MIDALISGRLFGTATTKTAKNGSDYATCKVRVACGEESAVFVSVISFSQTVVKALSALSDGDSVALSGALTPKVWTDQRGEARPTLDIMAHAVMTPYHVKRKREAMLPDAKPKTDSAGSTPQAETSNDAPFDDDIPF
jgi:single-stranded DNA-binding protein